MPSEQRLPDVVIPKVSKTGESKTDGDATTCAYQIPGKKYFEIDTAGQKGKVDAPPKR